MAVVIDQLRDRRHVPRVACIHLTGSSAKRLKHEFRTNTSDTRRTFGRRRWIDRNTKIAGSGEATIVCSVRRAV